MLRRSLKGLWYSLAALIIGCAVLVSLGRLLFPQAYRLKPEFERYLAERTGATVRIAEVHGAWRGFGPELRVSGIELLAPDTGEPVLKVGRFEAALDLPRSLLSWHAVMRRFEVDGLQALVEMDARGGLILPGLNLDSDGDSDISAQYVIDALLRQNRVAITNTEIRYRRRQGDVIPLVLSEVSLHNGRGQHQAVGNLQVHEGGTARFVLEFSDYPLGRQDQMAFYLESQSLDLARLPLPTAAAGVHVEDGELQLQIWTNWRDGGWRDGQAKLQLSALTLSNAEQQRKTIDRLIGHWHFARARDDRWYLHGEDVRWQLGGVWQPGLIMEGMVQRDGEQQRWGIDISSLALADVVAVAQFSSAMPADVRQQLTALALDARLPQLQIDFRLQDEQVRDWAIASQFADLRYQSERLPQLGGLQGRVLLSADGGALRLLANEQQADFHQLFRAPLTLQTLDLAARWQQQSDGVTVHVPQLLLRNADAQVRARARLELPETGEPELALAAQVEQGIGANKDRYLPVSVMSPELVRYLDGAIQQATVVRADALLRGPLHGFPFAKHDGVFDIRADVADASYRFQPEWPAVTELTAELRFLANSMVIDIARGRLAGWQLDRSQVVLEPMGGPTATLQVLANGSGSGKAALALLRDSPLRQTLTPLTDTLAIDGPLKAELALSIPLQHSKDAKVDGKVSFGNANLSLLPLQLPMTAARGEVRFAEYGIRSGTVQLQTLGGRVNASLSGDAGAGEIRFRGEATAADVAAWYPHPMQEHVSGRFAYEGRVLLPGSEQHGVNVELTSDLQGLAVRAPAPFGKRETETAPLRFVAGVNDGRLSLFADYRQQLAYQAERHGQEPLHAELLLGGTSFAGHAPGFAIRGELAALAAADWIPFVADVVAVAGRLPTVSTASTANPATPSPAELPAPETAAPTLALSMAAVDFYGLPLTQVQLGGRKVAAGYQLDLRADNAAGTVVFAADKPIQVNLDKFLHEAPAVTEPATPAADVAGSEPPPSRREPDSWPQVLIDCKQCRFYGRDVGKLQLSLLDQDADKRLSLRAERNGVLSARLDGLWSAARHDTTLRGRISSRDWGALTTDWGVDLSVRQSAGHVDLDLQWPESPVDFRLRDTRGTLTLALDKGYIARSSDNAERVLRVFSLLSLQSITRRLSLDFSDLFRDGFYYDSIRGEFAIADGKARTEGAVIDGVSASISISGETDFLARSLNQQIDVTPKLSSSLPILAGWAINPPAGLVVWLMNKLFIEPAVKVVTGLQYSVRGPWDNPDVIERGRTEKEVPLPEQGLPPPSARPDAAVDAPAKTTTPVTSPPNPEPAESAPRSTAPAGTGRGNRGAAAVLSSPPRAAWSMIATPEGLA